MSILKRAALTLAATAALTTALTATAQAGGFSRGSANLDGLYASEYVNEPIISSFGVTFVSPGRSYDSIRVRNPGFNPGAPVSVTNPEFLPGSDGFEFSESFAVPFASVGLKFGDRAQCVGSYAQPYGADTVNQGFARFNTAELEIDTFELGATCSVGFDVGRGRAYAIGGLFYEDLDYRQSRDFNVVPVIGQALGAQPGLAQTEVSSRDVGFRLGAAYEIPEIALKASVQYRSETEHDVEGQFTNVPFFGILASRTAAPALGAQARQLGGQAEQLGAQARQLGGQAVQLGAQAVQAQRAGNLALAQRLQLQAQQTGAQAQQLGNQAQQLGTQAQQLGVQANAILAGIPVGQGVTSGRAFGSATLPQQLELNVQSGVAPGTLVFGSVKWTDWSVIQRIDLFDEFSGSSGVPFTDFEGFFRDGYTVTLGVGRAFNEELAGSLSLTYDRGVGTGFDVLSDTYTVAGGVAYDLNEIANIRAGGAVIYFTEGEQTQGDFVATAGGEFGYALSTSLNIKF